MTSTLAFGLQLVCLLTVSRLSHAAFKLPSYISTCKQNDPQLNECVVRNGQKAIPKFINGDAKTKVPNLNPMTITEMRVAQGSRQIGMNITLRDIKVVGLKDVVFAKSRMEMDKRYSEWDFEIPRLEFIGQYTVYGRVLLLPISGDGDANITLTDVRFTYKHGWEFFEKNGNKHLKITKSDIAFQTSRAYFDLKNLFNGDRLLGDNMNRFLNENWKEVLNDIGPAMGQAFGGLISSILNTLGENVAFDKVYPPN